MRIGWICEEKLRSYDEQNIRFYFINSVNQKKKFKKVNATW